LKVALVEKEPRSSSRAYLVLAYCTVLQLLIYADRGIIAGLLNYAEAWFSIDKFHSGLLGTIFLAGFMMMSPVAAALASGGEGVVRAIGAGLLVWTLSVWACSAASSYSVLLVARAVAGCGESALCSLAPPLIDDAAPPRKKSAFLAIYFSAIFVGLGVGFAIAGSATSWSDGRSLFLYEGIIMAPLCLVSLLCGSCLLTRPAADEDRAAAEAAEGSDEVAQMSSWAESSSRTMRFDSYDESLEVAGKLRNSAIMLSKGGPDSLHNPFHRKTQEWIARQSRALMAILRTPVYTLLVLGYCATIFTIGGIAFWAPSYLQQVIGTKASTANGILGVITGLSGIIGTPIGGLLLDWMDSRWGCRSLQAARLCRQLVVLAAPVTMLAAAAQTRTLFFMSLALGQVLIFAATAPANIAMMEAVSPDQRGLALGHCTLASHLLGDLIPPVLVGYIADMTGSLRPGMWLLVLWLLWSVLFWSMAEVQTGREEAAREAEEAKVKAPEEATGGTGGS